MILSASSLAPPAEVEITAEPWHHLVLQNDWVRVFKVEIPGHGATVLHRHRHDYFIIALADSSVASEIAGKSATSLKLKAAEIRFAEGGFAHVARNLAEVPFPHVDVEVLQPKPSYKWEEERGVSVFEGGTQEILFVKDGVRASETDLQPRAMIPKHRHLGPHLVIAISDIDLENAVEGQRAKHVQLKSGESAWVPGGFTHTVMNAGQQNARFVALEFPPAK